MRHMGNPCGQFIRVGPRISDPETRRRGNSVPFGWSQGWIGHRSVGLVKVTTDDGIVGWGEGCSGAAAAVVENDFGLMLVGEDPTNRIGLWQKMFAIQYNANVAVGLGGSAISAVDMALWDITGKALDQPIYQLLGGRVRDRVAVYATGLYYTEGEFPTRLLDDARRAGMWKRVSWA